MQPRFNIRSLWSDLEGSIHYRPTAEERANRYPKSIDDYERFETPPAESIQTTKYKETVFRWTREMVEAAQPAYWFEISRFRVPSSSLGIITRLWTHLHYFQPGGEGEDPISYCLNDPACPWKHERFINSQYGFRLRWRLQIETIRPINDPVQPLYYRDQWELPGVPYGEQPSWTDQRFAWGNHSRNIRLIVPENTTVRLFVGIDGDCWNDEDCQGEA